MAKSEENLSSKKVQTTRLENLFPESRESFSDLHTEVKSMERFQLLESVGQGAMGEILLAKDKNLLRKVAYKQIHKDMATNKNVLMQFFTEAQITAQLEHPGVIPIYNLEVRPDGTIAYSMKLVKGRDLKEVLVELKQSIKDGMTESQWISKRRELLEYFLNICDAMAFAHSKDVIHRDLKPANIMLGPYNEIYVMDWGIARLIGSSGEVEPEKQAIGTPRYMSPEQARGLNNNLDGLSDLFSLGLILYEFITLRPAFKAKTTIDLLTKILKNEKEPIRHFNSRFQVPEALIAIMEKASANKKCDRYEDVSQLAEDIRRFLRDEEISAFPDTFSMRFMRWIRKNTQTALMIIMSLFILCSSSIIYNLHQQQQLTLLTQRRETSISQALITVAQATQVINGKFLYFAGLLERFSASSQEAILHGELRDLPTFIHQETGPVTLPEDMTYSKGYQMRLSFNSPAIKLAPNTDRQKVFPDIQKLMLLSDEVKSLFMLSHSSTKLLSDEQFKQSVFQRRTPLVWAFVGLENGIHFAYPGVETYDSQYDSRKRPWYLQAKDTYGIQWGRPYSDSLKQGKMLPCSVALYDNQQRFIGVAGFDLSLKSIKYLLRNKDIPALRATYLFTIDGDIVVDNVPNAKAKKLNMKAILAAIKSNKSGFLETDKQLMIYYPLESLGWYYLAVLDSEQLFQKDRQHG